MINILIAGDYCPMGRIADKLDKRDYTFFDDIKSLTREADYSILNFECPVVVGDVKSINKCGPALKTEPSAVDSIKYAGFDCVTLANNHFRDFGDSGCRSTIEELDKQHIDRVGGGMNINEAQQILYKDVCGQKIAIVNFCENEFSIATTNRAGAAPIDAIDNYNQITEARRNADYVLVIIHGGHEHYQLPSPRMKKLYRHYIDLGADAVVNHHQHCFSGYEYYNGKPIVYGLGNFCFDANSMRNSFWNKGYLVTIKFEASQPQIILHPYTQCDAEPIVKCLDSVAADCFNTTIAELNSIIEDDVRLHASFEEWATKREGWILSLFNSYHNRYLNAAAYRNIIKRPASKQEMLNVYNYIICEAHRDIVLNVLNKNYTNE